MSDDQVSLPYFLAILVIVGCIVRYLFFNGGSPTPPSSRSPEAIMRARELAVERIQQMFPQAERRSILWDLQRNGGNIQTTTERILAGRLETPPITFQPPPPPNQRTTPGSTSASTATRQPEKPAQPDLITRYNLKDKLNEAPPSAEEQDRKGKGWSSNREERQMSLQQRREQMILAARRKMEAKLAAERAAES
ncbi:Coupling of ubiquitin conjugation to ER degradation protein-like protein [Hapsidospora chrysogenum ATCC 11550]|uniref:Coupling of ubiquitin conjugation to ER degradation protein 1 n=1 Tax=Hapsidospora chrysogenum (strain ATCC 11550 / CBS 779.69 / DSM 880 / IAM 14645 / JCM 23072 / IMI 49137) TaxID=857340 RepID=A0A086TED0_HAPC1|nr:Coupling of ubiquitin conjugation to ER degradation protein-like protein [Hapsidospora chrysogenum ATCC 11550]